MELLHTSAATQWQDIGIKNHHGICVPLFSLRTQESCGIGEFLDLIPLIDWCNTIGFDVIQLLPLNDGGMESSPYSSLSATALNPLHLSLTSLPHLERLSGHQEELAALKQLSTSQRINYPELYQARERFLRRYFNEVSQTILGTYDFLLFLSSNLWLEEYALFKAIKIKRNGEHWELWPNEIKNPNQEQYRDLLKENKQESNYHKFLQYLCTKQLRQACLHAEKKNIFLKGDIPILINMQSADVWANRSLFNLDLVAGAPPDMYSQDGQKWGFPLYNWNTHETHNYSWWKSRLNAASQYYHIYRLDHIVGFFRIWGIPKDQKATQGHFIPENQEQWIPQGEKILKMMLSSCNILPIGEDLGVVPNEVRQCMTKLGICGTKVMRWERRWEGDKGYIDPKFYPQISMTTVSTHDSDTLQLWWKKHPDDAKLFSIFKGWNYEENLSLEHHKEILRDSHQSGSLFHINLLQEYFALIDGLTWPNPEDERINVPGIISPNNWSYRFRPYVEEFTTNAPLAEIMRSLVSN